MRYELNSISSNLVARQGRGFYYVSYFKKPNFLERFFGAREYVVNVRYYPQKRKANDVKTTEPVHRRELLIIEEWVRRYNNPTERK